MEQYKKPAAEVLAELGTSERGLTSEEAAARLSRTGKNILREGKKKSKIGLFFDQFKDIMTVILMLAAFLSGVLAFVTGDKSELADTGILLFVILLNAVVGFMQQYRADAAIEKLKTLSKATAKTVRDGKLVLLDAELLTAGDVVEIEEGDRIPADCRVLTSEDLRVDESALTGESRPVKKRDGAVRSSVLSERSNTVHMGTFCVKGRARCVVTATGMDTETGRIASLLGTQKAAPSPLDKTLARLGKIITVAVFAVAGLLFAGGLLARRSDFLHNLMTAVAVAVAAIPEGMSAVVTVILAMGVQRMAKSRAVMRKLSAVQTLGGCTCICSDKTGTLTQNRMTVEEIATDFSAPSEEYTGTAAQHLLLDCIRACHTVKGEAGGYLGDPTEIALLEYADRVRYTALFRTLGGEPFSSERKMMSVFAERNGKTALYVKGGADILLKKCNALADGGGKRPMTAEDRERIARRISAFSARAMRVIAFAVGEGREERGLCFVGLAAMLDPPREGVKEAVAACKRAGVRTVMITGDSPETAFAIAERLGIASDPREVITGEEIDGMGEDYPARAKEFSVYARVSPGHKTQIVRALQAAGEVVAMTGDGVNDAPSVKAANIGVAMGSGTDVTKSAADMVITDDDFSTVVRAVEEGRNVFYNIKKTVSFFLSTNFAEVLAVLAVTLFLYKYEFLTSTQLLWINLITDSLPVLALGVERYEGAMERPPVSERDVFARRSVFHMAFFGLWIAGAAVFLFTFALPRWGNQTATTMAFLALSLSELLHVFNVRKEYGKTGLAGFFENRALLVTVAVGLALNLLIALVPAFRFAFGLSALNGGQWALVAALSCSVLPLGACYRLTAGLLFKLKRRKRYILRRESAR